MALSQKDRILGVVLTLNHSLIFNPFAKQGKCDRVIKNKHGSKFLIHLSLTNSFHLIPSLSCPPDRIIYTWQRGWSGGRWWLSWLNRKVLQQVTLDSRCIPLHFRPDLSVGLASDHDSTFSDCFHAQSRNCVCITKNWPFFVVVLILFRPMLLT